MDSSSSSFEIASFWQMNFSCARVASWQSKLTAYTTEQAVAERKIDTAVRTNERLASNKRKYP
jgi:hypothetical protein